jgi:hypothetical protein
MHGGVGRGSLVRRVEGSRHPSRRPSQCGIPPCCRVRGLGTYSVRGNCNAMQFSHPHVGRPSAVLFKKNKGSRDVGQKSGKRNKSRPGSSPRLERAKKKGASERKSPSHEGVELFPAHCITSFTLNQPNGTVFVIGHNTASWVQLCAHTNKTSMWTAQGDDAELQELRRKRLAQLQAQQVWWVA